MKQEDLMSQNNQLVRENEKLKANNEEVCFVNTCASFIHVHAEVSKYKMLRNELIF